jgi:tRNA U54 and U55 pseudouridine synthase Pus10
MRMTGCARDGEIRIKRRNSASSEEAEVLRRKKNHCKWEHQHGQIVTIWGLLYTKEMTSGKDGSTSVLSPLQGTVA